MDATSDPLHVCPVRRPLSRRVALRRLAVAGLTLPLIAGPDRPLRAAAQEATPAAATSDPGIGTPVTLVGAGDAEIGRLTVATFEEPFMNFDPAAPPPRGYHFVLLGLTVENTGSQPWAVDAGRVFLQDAQGYVVYPATIIRTNAGEEPDFPTNQPVDPGQSASGVIGYSQWNGVPLARVFFAPANDRLILLAVLR
jgi:hypothetical protein